MKSDLVKGLMHFSDHEGCGIDPTKDICIKAKLTNFNAQTQTAVYKVSVKCYYETADYPSASGKWKKISHARFKYLKDFLKSLLKKKQNVLFHNGIQQKIFLISTIALYANGLSLSFVKVSCGYH